MEGLVLAEPICPVFQMKLHCGQDLYHGEFQAVTCTYVRARAPSLKATDAISLSSYHMMAASVDMLVTARGVVFATYLEIALKYKYT